MKLYEIAADYENLILAIENGEIPEEAIADTLDSITSLLVDKADNIACLIKNLQSDADAIKAEEKRLEDRRKSKERQVERLKAYLSDALLRSGNAKLETPRNRISFRRSECVVIDDMDGLMSWAEMHDDDVLTFKEPTVNKTAVKACLEKGIKIDGVHIETKQNIQIK